MKRDPLLAVHIGYEPSATQEKALPSVPKIPDAGSSSQSSCKWRKAVPKSI